MTVHLLNFFAVKMKSLSQHDAVLLPVNHFVNEWVEGHMGVIVQLPFWLLNDFYHIK